MPPIILTGVDPITTCTTICVPIGEGTFSFSCNFGYTGANPCTDAYDFPTTEPECVFHVIYHSPVPPNTCLPDICNP